MTNWPEKFTATLLGTAVGDSLGLPREGLTPQRAQRLFGPAPLTHRFLLRHGMISDDTEHACMTAQALLASQGNPTAFAKSLAWRLRGWLLALPAGIGLATLRSILKLCLGFNPNHSGVNSAGNGPAMRAPILGLWIAATQTSHNDAKNLIRASTRITHTDDRAYEGALAIALSTAQAATTDPTQSQQPFIDNLLSQITGEELRQNLTLAKNLLAKNASTQDFANQLNLSRGITGYINHTVPFALYCHWHSPNNFRQAVENAILAGGDTDSTAAIVGALSGAALGQSAIPPEWLSGILEFPRSIPWLKSLATRLANQSPNPQLHLGPQPLVWPTIPFRNLLFTVTVLTHGLRRLLPPY